MKVKTYDIINAGPKNRFMANGRIVSNSGRLFQPQNLYRPTMKAREIDFGIKALKTGSAYLVMDSVMEIAANAVRGCIVAPPGKKLVVADLSNIEGRFAAWVAGEEHLVKAFYDFDNGIGEDLYKVAYGKAFRVDPAGISKDQRAIGKVMSLMLQYAGGVGAFLTGAAVYHIDLDQMAAAARPAIPMAIWNEASGFYDWMVKERRSTFDLSRETFRVCESLKRMWREANPSIVAMWKGLEDGFRYCVNHDRQTRHVGKVALRRDGAWLRVILPSGRALCYVAPKDDGKQLSYMGIDPYTRRWQRRKTYGGDVFESICQGGSRDIMGSSMPRAERAGYETILTVHDELICEAPDRPEFNAEGLSRIMSTNPPWAQGLPLAAGGFEAYRYRKDG